MEIRKNDSNWFNTYPDLAVPGARSALLNYFDSILYLQIAAIPKVKKIFADVGKVDAYEGKIMEQNNLEVEKYLSKNYELLRCIRPLDDENQASYRSLDENKANLIGLKENIDLAYDATLYWNHLTHNK